MLNKVYNMVESRYKLAVALKEKPPNVLFYFDDISFDGSLKNKNNGIYNKIFMNGRHINISCISCIQSYVDCLLNARRNLTALLFFNLSDKDLDILSDEHSYLNSRKNFKKMVRDNLNDSKHNFIVVNYSNSGGIENMYQNSNFDMIDISKYN